MFDSGISVKNLIDELKNTEVDIALDIPNKTYVDWLNSLQQLLYTEVIKEQKKITVDASEHRDSIDVLYLQELIGNDKESSPRFEDIYAVYADGVQLIKSTIASGVIFHNTFYKDNNNIGYNAKYLPLELTIVYIVKPALVEVGANDVINDANVNVMVPAEFIDLVKAKLRGEAYKLANEDALAGKWLNDYNILLETFKAWITEKSPNFGM